MPARAGATRTVSAVTEMSRAIRLTLEQYAPTLRELDEDVLRDFTDIVNAFGHDLHAELVRRRKEENDAATATDR